MSKGKDSIRLFKNPLLEKFTHVHPITPLVIWAPVIAWLCRRTWESGAIGSWGVGALALSGFVFWTFFEYLMHRFIFHFEAHSRIGKRIIFLFHGIHHDDPEDPSRLVMPPVVSIVLATLIYVGIRLVAPVSAADPFFAGFLVGYLCYDYIHFALHHFTPQTGVGRFLKQYHMTHHFVTPEARWGVSSPLWDIVLGTLGREPAKPSQKAV